MTVPAGFVTPDPAPEPKPEPAKAPEGDTAVQDRINQLVKTQSETDGQLAAERAQNAALAAQINELTKKVEGLQPGSAPAPADDPIAALLSESQPATSKAKTLTPEETLRMVGAVVEKAIAPITQRFQAADEQDALAASQNQSLVRAAQAMPKLNDPNSELRQTFAQIWDGRPDLQSLPDGPELTAAIARGILVEARTAETTEAQQKVAATVTRPNLAGPTAQALKETNDSAKAAELKEKLAEKGAVRGLTGEEELQMLQLALRGK